MKRLFHQGKDQAGIDDVLDELQTASRSVRLLKEIEEFHDVRGEWKSTQGWRLRNEDGEQGDDIM